MDSLEKIIYSSLKDEAPDCKGWDKETIDFVLANRSDIERRIRAIAKSYRRVSLQQQDVEDIYNDLLMYLHNCDDYNLSKAVERSSSGFVVPLEGYVNTCIKYCVLRDCKRLNKVDSETISDVFEGSDEKEVSIFNTIPDESAEEYLDCVAYDLSAICKAFEPLRYRFGTDVYLLLFVRLLTLEDKSNQVYQNTLSVLGISKAEVSRLDDRSEDSLIQTFAKAISIIPIEKAIEILRGYVFSSQMVEKMIQCQM